MANKFWVGGNGTWNLSSTANWAATTNGASGATAPTPADDVYFDVNSNVAATNWTVTLGAAAACASLNVIGIDAQLTFNLGTLYTNTLTIYGNVNVVTTTGVFYSSVSPSWGSTSTIYFTSTNFIKLGMTATSTTGIQTSVSTNKLSGSANIGSVPAITTATSSRLSLAATNIAEPPIFPSVLSTSLIYTLNYPLSLPAISIKGIDIMGSMPGATTATSSRLSLASTNIAETPVFPSVSSTASLAFLPKYLSTIPVTPMRDIEKFGLNSANTITPIPYQFWG